MGKTRIQHTSVVKPSISNAECHVAVLAEWLRRLTRNQIPSGSVGSSPTDCEIEIKFFIIKADSVRKPSIFLIQQTGEI